MFDAKLRRDDMPVALNRRRGGVPGDAIWFVPLETYEIEITKPIATAAHSCPVLVLGHVFAVFALSEIAVILKLANIDEIEQARLASQSRITNGGVRVETG